MATFAQQWNKLCVKNIPYKQGIIIDFHMLTEVSNSTTAVSDVL